MAIQLHVPHDALTAELPPVAAPTLVHVVSERRRTGKVIAPQDLGWIYAYRPVPQKVTVRTVSHTHLACSDLGPTPDTAPTKTALLIVTDKPIGQKPLPWTTPVGGAVAFDDMVQLAADRLKRVRARATPTDTAGFWQVLAVMMYVYSPDKPLAANEMVENWIEAEARFYVHDHIDPVAILGRRLKCDEAGRVWLDDEAWRLFARFVAQRRVVVERNWIVRPTRALPDVPGKPAMPHAIFAADLASTKAQCLAAFRHRMVQWLGMPAMAAAHRQLRASRPLIHLDRALLAVCGFFQKARTHLQVGRVVVEGDLLAHLFEANAVPQCVRSVLHPLATRDHWVQRKDAPHRSYALAYVAQFASSRDAWKDYFLHLADKCGQPDHARKRAENESEAKNIFSLVASRNQRSCRAQQKADAAKGTCVRCPARTTQACVAELGVAELLPPDIEDLCPPTLMRLAVQRHLGTLDRVRVVQAAV